MAPQAGVRLGGEVKQNKCGNYVRFSKHSIILIINLNWISVPFVVSRITKPLTESLQIYVRHQFIFIYHHCGEMPSFGSTLIFSYLELIKFISTFFSRFQIFKKKIIFRFFFSWKSICFVDTVTKPSYYMILTRVA